MRLRSRLSSSATAAVALSLAACGDSGGATSGAGGGGDPGAGGATGATATTGSGSACVPHVEARDEDGCALPCWITQLEDQEPYQLCTEHCGPGSYCPPGTACHDYGLGDPVCELPCNLGCPSETWCDVETSFCRLGMP